jgi:hypothetical protein
MGANRQLYAGRLFAQVMRSGGERAQNTLMYLHFCIESSMNDALPGIK